MSENDDFALRDIEGIPLSYWTKDLDGDDIIVSVIQTLPYGKLYCVNEDGDRVVVDKALLLKDLGATC